MILCNLISTVGDHSHVLPELHRDSCSNGHFRIVTKNPGAHPTCLHNHWSPQQTSCCPRQAKFLNVSFNFWHFSVPQVVSILLCMRLQRLSEDLILSVCVAPHASEAVDKGPWKLQLSSQCCHCLSLCELLLTTVLPSALLCKRWKQVATPQWHEDANTSCPWLESAREKQSTLYYNSPTSLSPLRGQIQDCWTSCLSSIPCSTLAMFCRSFSTSVDSSL